MKGMSFRKRYFKTVKDFFKEANRNSVYAKRIKGIEEKNKISHDFAEKIMLAVTGVNSCVYCSYRHAKAALEKGVKVKEIQNILKGQFADFSQEEAIALAYAQHWTESLGSPDENARKRMIEFYGKQKTAYIDFYIQRVYMGNLICNTVDAYRNNVIPETGKMKFLLVYLLCAPIAFFIQSGTKSSKNNLKDKVNFIKDSNIG